MPNAFDLGQYKTNWNPTAGGPFVSIQDVMSSFGDVFQEIIDLLPDLIKILEGITPSQIIQLIETGLTAFIDLIFPTDGSESPIFAALITIIEDAPQLVIQLVSLVLSLLPDVLNAIISLIGGDGGEGIIGQLITVVITILPGALTAIADLLGGPDGSSFITQLVGIVIEILPQLLIAIITLIGDTPEIVTSLITIVTTILPDILTAIIGIITDPGGSGIVTSLVSIVTNILPDILTAIIGLIATAPGIVTQLVTVSIGVLPDLLTAIGTSISGLGGAGLLGQLVSLAGTILTSSGGLLAGFTDSGSILGQLIAAVGGTGSTLSDFADLFVVGVSDLTGLAAGMLTWLTGGGALPSATTLGLTGLTGLASGIASWLGAGGALPGATTLGAGGLTGLATGVGAWLAAGGALPAATSLLSSQLSGVLAQALIPSLTSGWGGTLDGARVVNALNTAVTVGGTALSTLVTGGKLNLAQLSSGAIPAGITLGTTALTGAATGILTWLGAGGALPAATTLGATGLTGLATGIGTWLGAGGALPGATTLGAGGLTGLAAGVGAWLAAGGALPGATSLAASGLTGLATGIGAWLTGGGALPAATRLIATQLTSGAIPAGVTLATSGLTGAATGILTWLASGGALPAATLLGATQLSSGAIPVGVTLGAGGLTGLATGILTWLTGGGALPSATSLSATGLTGLATGIGTWLTGGGALPGATTLASSGLTGLATGIATWLSGGGALPSATTLASTGLTGLATGIGSWLTGGGALPAATTLLGSQLAGSVASSLLSGVIATGIIPNLDTSKITTGTFSTLFTPMFNLKQVAGTNLVLDPSFENATAWGPTLNVGIQISTTRAHSGTHALKVTGQQAVYLSATDTALGQMKTRPGESYRVGGWIWPEAANAGTGSVFFQMNEYQADGTTFIGGADSTNYATLTKGQWNYVEYVFTMPANCFYFYPFFYTPGIPSTDIYYLDDVLIREETQPQSIIQQLFGGTTVGPALNTALTITGTALSTLFTAGKLNLAQLSTGAIPGGITLGATALTGLATGILTWLGSGGALPGATTLGATGLTGLATGLGTWLTGGGALPGATTIGASQLSGAAAGILTWLTGGGALPAATTLSGSGLTGLATGIGTWLTGGGALPGATTIGAAALTGLAAGVGTWLTGGGALPSTATAKISQVFDTLANPLSGYLGNLNFSGIMKPTGISSIFGTPATVTTVVQPTFDAIGAGAPGSGHIATWSHTLSASANAIIVAIDTYDWTGPGPATITVNVGSTPMTLLGSIVTYNVASSLTVETYLYGLLNPPTGAQTITATSGFTTTVIDAQSASYFGVTGFGTAVTNYWLNSAAATISVPSSSDQLVAMTFGGWTYTLSAFNQTQRYNLPYGAGLAMIMGDGPGAPALTFTCTQATNSIWGAVAVPLIGTTTTTANNFSLAGDLQTHLDTLVQAWGGSGTGHLVSDLQSILANNIGTGFIQGVLGGTNIGNTVVNHVDALVQGINGGSATGNSLAVLQGAMTGLRTLLGYVPSGSPPSTSVAGITQTNNTYIANTAATKPLWQNIDPTLDTTISIQTLKSYSTTPTVAVTQSAGLIGFLNTSNGGVKQSICWMGYPTGGTMANIGEFYINIYQVNASTGASTWVYSTPNIASSVGTGSVPVWNFYNLASANYITTQQGYLYAVELVVIGSGTYNLVGMTNPIPKYSAGLLGQLGATRSPTTVTPGIIPTVDTIAYGTGSANGCTASNSNPDPITFSININAGADAVLVLAELENVGGTTVTAMTVGGKSCTNIAGWQYAVSGSTGYYLYAWYFVGTPGNTLPTGSQTVSLSYSGGSTNLWAVNAVSLFNVGGFGTPLTTSGSGTAASHSAPNTQNQLLVNIMGNYGAAASAFGNYSTPATTGWNYVVNTLSKNMNSALVGWQPGGASPAFASTLGAAAAWGSTTVPVYGRLYPAPATMPAVGSTTGPQFSASEPLFGLSGAAGATQYAPQLIPIYASQTLTNPTVTFPWANHFDVVLAGDGGGGKAGGSGFGHGGYGGYSGAWATPVTLTKAQMGSSSLTCSIGTGGVGGAPANANGGNGAGSSIVIPGYSTITAPGGAGQTVLQSGPAGLPGASLSGLSYNGNYFPGGGGGSGPSGWGGQPGGGGGGGTAAAGGSNNGGNGGPGIGYIVCYM